MKPASHSGQTWGLWAAWLSRCCLRAAREGREEPQRSQVKVSWAAEAAVADASVREGSEEEATEPSRLAPAEEAPPAEEWALLLGRRMTAAAVAGEGEECSRELEEIEAEEDGRDGTTPGLLGTAEAASGEGGVGWRRWSGRCS